MSDSMTPAAVEYVEVPTLGDLLVKAHLRFGDSPALADELLALVLAGKKTATCWAASEGGKGVEIGRDNVLSAGARIFPGVKLPDGAIRF